GQGTSVSGGATADAPSGPNNLVYSFNFPFASGWTVPGSENTTANTLVKGTGTVGFRYCMNTINFTVTDPEIELDGDDNSRMIFRVDGTDGTAFPNSRAVMIKLIPGQAESRTTQNNGDGTTTVKYERIPGYIPAEGTGIFAGFYPAFSPEFDGTNPRPDRFGSLSLTYTYPNPSP
ncbi:MAG: HtaA domain-containing protein, partial [Actinomycetota bacterium]|nr:HtaA domain-containing protein [Actinomycetota bacterium]